MNWGYHRLSTLGHLHYDRTAAGMLVIEFSLDESRSKMDKMDWMACSDGREMMKLLLLLLNLY